MNWIKGSKFKIDNIEYMIFAVWWSGGKKTEYEFKSTDKTKPETKHKMSAEEFEIKITDDKYSGQLILMENI